MKARLLLLLGALPCLACAAVFQVLDPVGPDDTVLVVGDGLPRAPRVEVARLPDGEAGEPKPAAWSGAGQSAEVLAATSDGLKFLVPAKMPAGIVAWRLDGQFQGLLNRPTAWWLQGDRGPSATPGGWLRVCGKSLGTKAVVMLRGTKTRRVAAVADRYTLRADLPADMTPGTYQVYVHNGLGGPLGWSEPLALVVDQPRPEPGRVYDAREAGAQGNGDIDDTVVLQGLLDRAGAEGGGTVRLPRGRYLVSATIKVPPRVTLRGDTRELTSLCWPDADPPLPALVQGTHGFAVTDLTLYASGHQHVLVGDLGSVPDAGDITLARLRVRANTYRGHLETKEVDKRLVDSLRWSTGGGDTVRMGGRNLKIVDCDLYGSGRSIFLNRARGALIRGNRLFNGRWGWYTFEGSDGLIFEDNTLTGADLMSTGGGLSNFTTPSSEHIYYARNQLDLMHGWDREAMTSDAGGGAWFGPVASVDGAKTTMAGDVKTEGRDWAGAGVFIVDGPGRGQWRRVLAVDGRVVTLDRPWLQPPGLGSIVTMTMFHGQYLFVDNRFSDSGVAIQLYGMACEAICDGNVSMRTAGFHNFGMDYQGIQPSWYIQWLNNEVAEGNVYRSGHDNYLLAGEAHLGIFALPPRADFEACLTLGCVARGNRLRNNAYLAIGGADPANPAHEKAFVRNVVAEHNRIEDTDYGIWLRKAQADVLLRDNQFKNVRQPICDERAEEQAAAAKRAALLREPGPLVWYRFEEAAGDRAPDATGHGYAARSVGEVKWVEGRQGKGAQFGKEVFLRVNEPTLFNLDAVTLACWIKPDTVDGRQGLIAKRLVGTEAPFILSLWDGGLEFEATDTNGKWSFNFRSPKALTAGVWQHVAAVVTPGVGVTLYANGRAIATKENAGTRVGNLEPLIIGREAWSGINLDPHPCFYSGLMDDVKLWGRPLSAAELQREAGGP
ncbi:MAG: hypothetical protein HZB16_10650 [Armatimonadetes bacterium]|nr:hypothetical protein [Armatimonadota bacterium]